MDRYGYIPLKTKYFSPALAEVILYFKLRQKLQRRKLLVLASFTSPSCLDMLIKPRNSLMKGSLLGKLGGLDPEITTRCPAVINMTVKVDLKRLPGLQIPKNLLGFVSILHRKHKIKF